MGVLRRFALPGVPVYNGKLSPELVERLLATYYDPYHAALAGLIEARHARFGAVWHIDCHSMKSRGNAMNIDNGAMRPDFVIGNRDGKSCSTDFVAVVVDALRGLGYEVGVNTPYKGAQLVAAYSDPTRGRHSLQIEINRALYLDEARFAKHEGFATLQTHLSQVLEQVAAYIRARGDEVHRGPGLAVAGPAPFVSSGLIYNGAVRVVAPQIAPSPAPAKVQRGRR
ncbi:hypothetical protein A9975_01995 [Cupriavidus sp. UME77]|nr:hypothetical protein [Cupriavidus sp. UME77]